MGANGKWAVWVIEESISVSPTPFTYTGEGEVRTPPFFLEESTQYDLTFTTTWDGDFCVGWHDSQNELIRYRDTGSWADFPNSVAAGKTYEYTFDWNYPSQIVYLSIEHASPISNWTISISEL